MTWIPNALTASRILLLIPLMLLLIDDSDSIALRYAFVLFLIAGITDGLDGWAARRLGSTSNLGVFFDPLADKVFANVLLVYLACRFPDWLPMWMVLLLLAREFAVQGFRSMAPCVGVVITTDMLSKLKLVFQLIAAGAVIAGLGWEALQPLARPLAMLGMVLALLSGLVSMLLIFWKNRDLWLRQAIEMERR
jgi:CDP-diacylglycerol--glycerol-3-phosphate 3-phosphatidyltransferase